MRRTGGEGAVTLRLRRGPDRERGAEFPSCRVRDDPCRERVRRIREPAASEDDRAVRARHRRRGAGHGAHLRNPPTAGHLRRRHSDRSGPGHSGDRPGGPGRAAPRRAPTALDARRLTRGRQRIGRARPRCRRSRRIRLRQCRAATGFARHAGGVDGTGRGERSLGRRAPRARLLPSRLGGSSLPEGAGRRGPSRRARSTSDCRQRVSARDDGRFAWARGGSR
jgi:hypothetical protein